MGADHFHPLVAIPFFEFGHFLLGCGQAIIAFEEPTVQAEVNLGLVILVVPGGDDGDHLRSGLSPSSIPRT